MLSANCFNGRSLSDQCDIFYECVKIQDTKKRNFFYFQSLEYAEEELRRSLELLADNIKGEDSDSLGSSKKRKLASCEI